MGSIVATRSGLSRWLVPGALILLLLVAIGLIVAGVVDAQSVGFLGMLIGYATTSILIAVRSRVLEGPERSAWMYLSAGTGLVATGVLVNGVLDTLGVVLPAFGAIDSFFLAGYLTLVVALVKLARADGGGREWMPTLIDAAIGGISLSVLVWTTFYHELLTSLRDVPWWEGAVAAAYPVLDIAAVTGLIIIVMRRSQFHFDLRLIFVALGLATQVFSDFILLTRGVGRTFDEAQPEWWVLLMAVIFLVAGSAIVDRAPKKREFPEVDTPIWFLVWPYLLGASLLGVHVATYRSLAPGADGELLLNAVIAVGILIFFSQLLSIRRNRRRVDHQRSELVASVSHELRTPLTAMVGYLSLLDEDADGFPEDARREMIAEATTQAKHMSRLVSDLVMLARGINRELPLEITEVPLSQIITSALRNTDPESTKIDVEVETEASIRVDAVRVQQALLNFLSNAVRYGGDQALLVAEVRGDDLLFEVHDSGDGVPTRYEAKIWERFERGANRLNATNPGLGIGLAIVVAIAQSHGGRAEYTRSERLGGACFSLLIPGCVSPKQPASVKVEAFA